MNKKTSRLFLMVIFHVLLTGNLGFSASKKDLLDVRSEVINLDIRLLEKTAQYLNEDESDLKEIPMDVLSLNGKQVSVAGHFIPLGEDYFDNKPVTNFAISKIHFGCLLCSGGSYPTIFNTLIVDMKDGWSIKPPFSHYVEVVGTFVVQKEYFVDENSKKRLDSLFYIKNASAKKTKPYIF